MTDDKIRGSDRPREKPDPICHYGDVRIGAVAAALAVKGPPEKPADVERPPILGAA